MGRKLSYVKYNFALYLAKDIVFPSTLLSNSLRELKLVFPYSTLNVAANNFVPNLTSLFLYGLKIVGGNHNTSNTLTFTFPVLETFTVYCEWLNVSSVEIHAPLLKTFESGPSNVLGEYDYFYLIVAPLLKFTCSSNLLQEKFILDGSSIISAFLRCNFDPYDPELRKNIGIQVRNLLNEFTNLEELELSRFLIQVSQLGPPLRRLDKLKKLSWSGDAAQLIEFLDAVPTLKSLSINVKDYDNGAFEYIPTCIMSYLEDVEFRKFTGEEPQYNLAKFFLKNGQRLKKMVLVADRGIRMNQNEVREYVPEFRGIDLVMTSDE